MKAFIQSGSGSTKTGLIYTVLPGDTQSIAPGVNINKASL
jgi:hypothetical protein